MNYDRSGPHARKELHSWRYYNDHFKVERLPALPPQGPVGPPPAYKNIRQFHDFNAKGPLNVSKHSVSKEQTFWEKLIDGFDHYCDTSSLHGLKYVGENRFSKPERIFWLIAFLVAVALAIVFITSLYVNYDNSPVIVNFSPEMINVQNIPFPAVTICNTNVALKSRAEIVKRSGTPAQQLVLDDMCNSNTSTNHDDIGPISWNTMENVIINITQKCSEMVIGCKWQSKTYVCKELINSVLTDDGYCCTFNRLPVNLIYKIPPEQNQLGFPNDIVPWYPEAGYPANAKDDVYPYRAFGRGVNQGLSLVLDAALDEYYCSTTNGFGFKIQLHTPREAPKIADLGFLVQPGIESRIVIDTNIEQASDSIRGIDYRKRKCFFAFEKYLRYYNMYNARNCMLECEANYTYEQCGCTPYYLPRDMDMKICDKSDEQCTTQAKFVIERYGPEKLACDCLPGCYLLEYFPSVLSEGKLMNLNNITDSEFLGNYTQEYFAENMAIVHFFFGAERFQVQVKSSTYTFSEFLSNTGGLLGLFLGFSFLSVVEIIYFLFIRGACVWCQNKRSKNQVKQRVFVQ